jgi:hypothetical protein
METIVLTCCSRSGLHIPLLLLQLLLLSMHRSPMLVDMHPPPLLSPPKLLHVGGKKQNILVKGLRTLIGMCRSNNALIRESHSQMSHRLAQLEESQCEMRSSTGLVNPEPRVYHTLLFLLPLWKILGLGTATPMMMKTMMTLMMKSKRSPSDDLSFLFSLFGA